MNQYGFVFDCIACRRTIDACVQGQTGEEEEVQGDWMAVLSILCVFIGFFFKVHLYT